MLNTPISKERLLQIIIEISIVFCAFSDALKPLLFGFSLSHIGNAIIFLMFLYLLPGRYFKEFYRNNKPLVLCALLFIIVGSVSALIYGPTVFLYLWSLRTYLRIFFLIGCIYAVFDKKMLRDMCLGINIIMIAHTVLTLIQFFVLGVRWDYLNGIFGTSMGGDGAVNILLISCLSLTLYLFYKRAVNALHLMVVIFISIFNASLTEVKFYYIELLVCLALYIIFTDDKRRMLKLLPVIAVIFISSVPLMIYLYPYTTDFWGSNMILEETHAYRNELPEGISRLGQISGIKDKILSYGISKRPALGPLSIFLGLGLGSAEWGYSPAFCSEFFSLNTDLGYEDFLEPIVFAETGFAGLFLFNAMMIYGFIISLLTVVKTKCKRGFLGILVFAMLVGAVIYDNSLRSNNGYLLWVLSGIALKEIQEELPLSAAHFPNINRCAHVNDPSKAT